MAEGRRPTDYLRDLSKQDWEAATRHAFCRELADGTLPLDKMRWYLVQDHKFIDGFVRLLASAVAHAPGIADSAPMAQFLALITSDENTYFLRSFEALEVSDDDRAEAPSPVTVELQTAMECATRSGRYELMLAVLVVAEWSYLSWAEPFEDPPEDLPFWFREWIDLHTGAYFTSVVAHLRGQLDTVWHDLDDVARGEVADAFGHMVTLERRFFDAAYAAGAE